MGLHKFVPSIWDFGVCVLRVCCGLDDDHGDADDDHDEGIVPLYYLVYYVYMLLYQWIYMYYISTIHNALSHYISIENSR